MRKIGQFLTDEGWGGGIPGDIQDLWDENCRGPISPLTETRGLDDFLPEVAAYCNEFINDEQHDYRLELLPVVVRYFVCCDYWGPHEYE
jgi:hypothetical protein